MILANSRISSIFSSLFYEPEGPLSKSKEPLPLPPSRHIGQDGSLSFQSSMQGLQ